MSRLSRIHEDYLDPDRYLGAEDFGHEEVLAKLKEQSTNRWRWDQIDCCWTGKDADLEPHGDQGLHLKGVDDEFAYATVHAGKTVAGDDCCFNLSDDATDEQMDKAREAYLEQMTEVVCGCGYPGEWSGDDWFLTFEEQIKVPTVLTKDGTETDAEATALALIAEAQKVLVPFEKEMAYVDKIGNMLAGWKHANGRRAKEGKPGKYAAWMQ